MKYKLIINHLKRILYYDLEKRKNIIIDNYEYTFESGKCYCLDMPEKKGWLISKCFTGQVLSKKFDISLDGCQLNNKDLQKQSIYVGVGQNRNDGFFKQIKKISCNTEDLNFITEKFGISKERIYRPYNHISSERWRMGFALGYLMKKNIYCFPWIDSNIVDMYGPLWLKDFVKEVKNNNGIILIPTEVTECNSELFDLVLKN